MGTLTEEELSDLYVSDNPHDIPGLVDRIDRLQAYLRAINREVGASIGSRDVYELRRSLASIKLLVEAVLKEG